MQPLLSSGAKVVLCPCYVLGKNKAEVDGRQMTLLDTLLCPSEFLTRQQIRSKYNLGVSGFALLPFHLWGTSVASHLHPCFTPWHDSSSTLRYTFKRHYRGST